MNTRWHQTARISGAETRPPRSHRHVHHMARPSDRQKGLMLLHTRSLQAIGVKKYEKDGVCYAIKTFENARSSAPVYLSILLFVS